MRCCGGRGPCAEAHFDPGELVGLGSRRAVNTQGQSRETNTFSLADVQFSLKIRGGTHLNAPHSATNKSWADLRSSNNIISDHSYRFLMFALSRNQSVWHFACPIFFVQKK